MQSSDDASGTGQSVGVTEQTVDSRNQYAETAVQQQVSLLGEYQQLQTSLAPLQTVFDVSSSSAIPSALNQLFQSFSNWSTQPNDATAQASVISAAQQTERVQQRPHSSPPSPPPRCLNAIHRGANQSGRRADSAV